MRASVEGNCHLIVAVYFSTTSYCIWFYLLVWWTSKTSLYKKEEIYVEISCYCPVISALCHFPRVFQRYL